MALGSKLGQVASRRRGRILAAVAAIVALAVVVFAFDVPITIILALAILWVLGYLTVAWQMPPKSHWPRGRK